MSQIALVIGQHLGPFELRTIPIYTAGPGQLLIKIHSAALNPADWKLQRSGQVVAHFPAVLGLDRAGEVVEVGNGVVGFKEDDRVVTPSAFIENKYQGFQQYAITDAHITSKIPPTITYDQAATLPIALSTAISGFFAEFPHGAGLPRPLSRETQNFGAGKGVLIIGGSSSVGQFAIQSAKLIGFTTIIATASLKNERLLKSQGATHVLDRSLDAPALVAAVSAITSDKPLELVYDSIGTSSTEVLGIAVAGHWHTRIGDKGLFVTVDPAIPDDSPSPDATGKVGKITPPGAPSWNDDLLKYGLSRKTVKVAKIIAAPNVPWNRDLLSEVFHDTLYGWLESGVIKPTELEVVEGGLAAIPRALERLEDEQVSGYKLIVHPHDTSL